MKRNSKDMLFTKNTCIYKSDRFYTPVWLSEIYESKANDADTMHLKRYSKM